MASYQPTETEQSQIETILKFQEAVAAWGRNQLPAERVRLRRLVNQLSSTVRSIVRTARCSKKLDIQPPPRVTGYIIRGVDPFDHIFEAPYDMDLRQQVIDMCDQAIGVIQAGNFEANEEPKETTDRIPNARSTSKVFVVHGHDQAAKESVARFLERLGLEAVVLHEQPSSGRTVMEKVEKFSDVGYSVVLMTPDDVGAKTGQEKNLAPRARQNVILELGYFLGKLGRENVAVLLKGEVEKPSDFEGFVHITMDAGGGWKMKLAQELKTRGLDADYDKLV